MFKPTENQFHKLTVTLLWIIFVFYGIIAVQKILGGNALPIVMNFKAWGLWSYIKAIGFIELIGIALFLTYKYRILGLLILCIDCFAAITTRLVHSETILISVALLVLVLATYWIRNIDFRRNKTIYIPDL
ncbi:MAG: hypothetical protein D8M58_21595 [Calditrichaeota bacterium]|nr:MAG: hypothetical protein DWQ03_17060 [Calditrichota bacterium]MBL1208009.1 hypothetical protein [Calditrichota bacterium]NOG47845.1 hypothetical protein [Calditrichota bacterium]